MKTMNFYSFGQLLVGSLVGVVRSYAPQNRFESIAHWSQRLFEVKIIVSKVFSNQINSYYDFKTQFISKKLLFLIPEPEITDSNQLTHVPVVC